MTTLGQVLVSLGLDSTKFKKGLKDAEGQTNKFAKLMHKSLMGIAAGFTLGAVIKGINESVEAFRTQERAIASLNQSLMNSGVYTAEYSQHLQDLSSEIQKFSNYGDEAVESAIALGQSFTGNLQLTDNLIKATVDYAAATGQDLQSAFTLVGKSIGTSTNALARYGVSLDDGMTKEQKMAKITQVLEQRFNGSAKTMANSSEQLKNATGDLAEAFGAIFNPAVERTQNILISGAKKLTHWLQLAKALHGEINGLSAEQLEQRINKEQEILNRMEQQKSFKMYGGENNARYKELKKDINDSQYRLNKLKEQSKELEKTSKDNYTPISDTKSGKTGTDTALEAYKNFVEEYKQATREYEATLQARSYVEKVLGIKSTDEDYQNAISVYKNYFAKRKEIEQSEAKNKAELLKSEETKLQQDLQLIALQKTDETAKKQQEIIKGYQDQMRALTLDEDAYQSAGGFLGSFGANFEQRLAIEKNYYAEREKLRETAFNSDAEKQQAYNELSLLRTRQYNQLEIDVWRKRGHDIYDIMNNTFSSLLTNYGDFSDNMKQLVINLSQYVIKELMAIMVQAIATKAALSSVGGGGGGFFGFIGNLFGKSHSGHTYIPTEKHHYGGITAPNQTEHFALLKNNERVLSPSETQAYNNNESGGGANYIVYAPQVRAMDSNDVAKWFNDNKQQVLSIVSDGIKNNNQGLRTQIQGV